MPEPADRLGLQDLGDVEDLVRPDHRSTVRRIELLRGAWGLTLLLLPVRVLSAADTEGDRAITWIGRVLGARHLTQAVLSGARPSPEVLAMGVWVDGAHALWGLGLAASGPGRTVAGIADAVAALGWAGAGYHDLVNPRAVLPQHTRRRDALARRVLRALPGGAPLADRVEHERARVPEAEAGD